MPIQDLKGRIARLPEQPGVYLYYNEGGDTLYVGKAKVLRDRVLQDREKAAAAEAAKVAAEQAAAEAEKAAAAARLELAALKRRIRRVTDLYADKPIAPVARQTPITTEDLD